MVRNAPSLNTLYLAALIHLGDHYLTNLSFHMLLRPVGHLFLPFFYLCQDIIHYHLQLQLALLLLPILKLIPLLLGEAMLHRLHLQHQLGLQCFLDLPIALLQQPVENPNIHWLSIDVPLPIDGY